MSLIPRNSLFDFTDFFDNFLPSDPRREASSGFLSPRVDIKDKGDHYEIVADLPGVDKDDLSVSLADGVLTIEASTEQEDTEKDGDRVIRRERRTGKYLRSFTLGQNVQESDISAKFKDGVLKLSAPKASEARIESKTIPIG